MENTAQFRITKKLPVKGNKEESMAPALWSSLMMAVAGMGDALLYAYLPVEAISLGMTAFVVGVLLSINKFVRFFTNRWIAFAAQKVGIRNILILGVVLSASTVFVYGLNPPMWIWVTARALWGLAYSSLRFCTIQYAGASRNTGGALGVGRSIQETGPLLAYWTGPLLINTLNAELTFNLIGAITLLLLPLFYLLPQKKQERQAIRAFSFSKPEAIDLWVFLSSFVVEGLLVVGISQVIDLNFSDTGELMITAGLYISIRRFLNIVIAPASGWMSDRWSFQKLFHYSSILIISGLVLIALGGSEAGILLAFTGSAINVTLLPVIALLLAPAAKNFEALTKLSTSRDLGSAFGALLGLSLLTTINPHLIFAILAIALALVWLYLFKLDVYNDRDR